MRPHKPLALILDPSVMNSGHKGHFRFPENKSGELSPAASTQRNNTNVIK
jgi:hypothetical protein